jgi:hypothetical protein
MKTKMTDEEVREAFAAIAARLGDRMPKGMILEEIVTPAGRWLNPAPVPAPMTPRAAATLVRKVIEAANTR